MGLVTLSSSAQRVLASDTICFSAWFSARCSKTFRPRRYTVTMHSAALQCLSACDTLLFDGSRHTQAVNHVASVRIARQTDWIQLHRASTVSANRACYQVRVRENLRWCFCQMFGPCRIVALWSKQLSLARGTRPTILPEDAGCNPCESRRIA